MLKLFSSIYCSLHLIYFYFLYSCYYHIVAQFEITGSWNHFYPLSPDLEGNGLLSTVDLLFRDTLISKTMWQIVSLVRLPLFFFFLIRTSWITFWRTPLLPHGSEASKMGYVRLGSKSVFFHHTLQFSMKTFMNFWSSSPFSFF